MKISKSTLNKILNEEYSRATSRRELKGLRLSSVDSGDLLDFVSRWSQVGSYVQENVQQLVTGDFEDIDPSAIVEAKKLLEGFHPDIDEAFLEYEKHIIGND